MPDIPSRIFSEYDLRALLEGMITPRGIQASSDKKFASAVFGRDSLWIGRFMIDTPRIAELALTSVAEMQGTVFDPCCEEEPGKIAHEKRVRDEPGTDLATYDALMRDFGESAPGEVTVFATLDATPLFIVLLGEYCERYGRALLGKRIRRTGGEQVTMYDVFVDALDWVEGKIYASPRGLLEASRQNTGSTSHLFHVMRDSSTAYRVPTGGYANPNGPIAYLEVQGYAYDALMHASKLTDDPAVEERTRAHARELRAAVERHFWLAEMSTLAGAIDADPDTGMRRVLPIVGTMQLEFLGTGIFDHLPQIIKGPLIESMIEASLSDDVRTVAGLRSVATRHDALWGAFDYDCARSVWPIQTHLAARGLRRQGYHSLARDLAARMVNAINVAGRPRELFFAELDGRIIYDPKSFDAGIIPSAVVGEDEQAWTIAAAIDAMRAMLSDRGPEPQRFERQHLRGGAAQLWNDAECAEAYAERSVMTSGRG